LRLQSISPVFQALGGWIASPVRLLRKSVPDRDLGAIGAGRNDFAPNPHGGVCPTETSYCGASASNIRRWGDWI
jgi:hypothetical protein